MDIPLELFPSWQRQLAYWLVVGLLSINAICKVVSVASRYKASRTRPSTPAESSTPQKTTLKNPDLIEHLTYVVSRLLALTAFVTIFIWGDDTNPVTASDLALLLFFAVCAFRP